MSSPRRIPSARLLALLAGLPLLALLLAAPAGCFLYKDDPLFCADQDLHTCETGPATCASDVDCSGDKPACDTAESVCVQCTPTSDAACVAGAPVCGDDHECRSCAAHSECDSSACLPSGACGDDSNVAYVSPDGIDNELCSKAAPCKTIAKALGLTPARPYVKLSGATDERVQITDRTVTLLADPGAKLTSMGNGSLLQINGTSEVEIYDLEISGASGAMTGYGILVPTGSSVSLTLSRAKLLDNAFTGLSMSGGKLTLARSTISGNLGGGIELFNSLFDFTNNFIYQNGRSTAGTVGGVAFRGIPAGTKVFAFNTIIDNNIPNDMLNTAGVFCNDATFTAHNNIISRNYVAINASAANSNTIGACVFATSLIGPDISLIKFKSPDNSPYDYHLTSGSSAIDKALTASSVAVDFDGEARPQGAAKDIGADEYKP